MENTKIVLLAATLFECLISFAQGETTINKVGVQAASNYYYLNAISNGDGTVTGAGMYTDDAPVTIEAIPNTGFYFVNWSDGNTDNPRILTLTKDISIAANFDLIDRTASDGLLPGVFSVSSSTYISFSQGNLQYKPYPGLWRLANHQYDFVGNSTLGTVSVDGVSCDNLNISDTYPGWLDLFGFGTGDNPTKYSNITADYSVFNEWGINTISNADNSKGWRTLTASEWDYLISTRANASELYGQATVNGVKGLILLPDSWSAQSGIAIVCGAVDYSANVFTVEQWKVLETAGAVFLPSAGERQQTDNTYLSSIGSQGKYWSSTSANADNGNYFFFSSQYVSSLNTRNKSFGLSVRLVAETSPAALNRDITLNTDGNGSTYGAGSYSLGSIVTIGATPNEGYAFSMWSDGCPDNPRVITLTTDIELTAKFVRPEEVQGEGRLNALFSISDTSVVYFSQGNLQYQASSNLWRFAAEQYETIGNDNVHMSPDYEGWIDLFGWGTSGWESSAVCYQPYDTSSIATNYKPGGSVQTDLTGDYAKADWGVYNAITNGGRQSGQWRTLHWAEWRYIFVDRHNAANKFGLGRVNGIEGVVILPDVWVLPAGCTFTNSLRHYPNQAGTSEYQNMWQDCYADNVYTLSQWELMENAGAVFLPNAGSRSGSTVYPYAKYWSSKGYSASQAISLNFSSYSLDPYNWSPSSSGMSVRLVQEGKKEVSTDIQVQTTHSYDKKIISNGHLYIQLGDVLYDATGKRVK